MSQDPLNVMVVGAAGRMGSLTARTVADADDLRLAAIVDPAWHESDETVLGTVPSTAVRAATVDDALAATQVDVAVDFTVPAVTFGTVRSVLSAGVDAVVGTTGLSSGQVAELDRVRAAHDAHLFIAPNFALGAVLLMRFAREAARYYADAEIVELHHSGKVDAPSGTALRTARLMVEAPGSLLGDPPAGRQDPGETSAARGLAEGRVHLHSVRLPGLVAHQEVIFGALGETLTMRHDSTSRESFMAGVLLAVRNVGRLEGTVVGLEHLLT